MLETAIYVRVSTEEQAQEGFSIRAQEQKLKDYTKIKDWSIYKVYADEGISGKNIEERPAINEMIEDIKKGEIKNVLVFKIDRLTRSTADLIYLIELFNKHNCAFNSLMESIDTQSPAGRMFIKIIGIFAEFERENIIERAKLGFERKVKEGYTLCSRVASYGYDRKAGVKVQTINENEARIVREIFDMFVNQHMSFLDIAKNLNSRNIPTKENSTWHARTIKNALTNCNYIGNVRYATKDKKRNFEIEGLHEPIISKELYDKTQELISKISTKNYTKHPTEEHYFAGILFCGKCGGKLVSHGDTKKRKDGTISIYSAYRCRNYLNKTCDANSVGHKNVEKAFSEYIEHIDDFNIIYNIEIDKIEKQHIERQEVINSLNKQYKKLKIKEKEILNFYVNDSINFDEYVDMKKSITKAKEHIYMEIEKIGDYQVKNTTVVNEDIIKNLKENWDLLTNTERRQFLIQFVDKIMITGEKQNSRNNIVKIHDVKYYTYS